jgi:glycyl-tRNA synthetase
VKTSVGWIEVVGIAHRGDYDLKAHAVASGREMRVPAGGGSRLVERWIPNKGAIGKQFKSAAGDVLGQLDSSAVPGIVVGVGGKKIELDEECFTLETTTVQEMVFPQIVEPSFGLDRLLYVVLETAWRNKDERGWLALPKVVGPYDALVAPLMVKDGMGERAKEIHRELRQKGMDVYLDLAGSIGRRYARADEIGVPRAITIDHRTLEDGTVTVRERDLTEQKRASIEDLQ